MSRDIMIRITGLLLLALTAFSITGCEDRINLDLKSSEPRIVIEGCLGYWYGQTYFRISRSTDFYQPNEVEAISGALVVVSNDAGSVDTLGEDLPSSPGIYRKKGFRGINGVNYRATVTVDGQVYVARTTVVRGMDIRSVHTSYQPGDGIGSDADEGYRLHVHFEDQRDVTNYARLRLTKNSLPISDYYFYDDKFSDGSFIDYDFFPDVFQVGDTVLAELISMDKNTYEYFLTLSDVVATEEGTNSFDATPANPNTNWSGGALGYFGGFYFSRKGMIVK